METADILALESAWAKKYHAAWKAIESIPKNGFNTYFKYKYVTDQDVLQAVREVLNNNGLIFAASLSDVSRRELEKGNGKKGFLSEVWLTFTITDIDTGYSKDFSWASDAEDDSDKSIQKGATAGLKYWLIKTFMIPADSPDTDAGKKTEPAKTEPKKPSDTEVYFKALSLAKEEKETLKARCEELGKTSTQIIKLCMDAGADTKEKFLDMVSNMKKEVE